MNFLEDDGTWQVLTSRRWHADRERIAVLHAVAVIKSQDDEEQESLVSVGSSTLSASSFGSFGLRMPQMQRYDIIRARPEDL